MVGWSRRRELDEHYTLGAVRANLRRIAEQGRLPEQDVDVLAHMIHAAISEASMLVAGDEHPRRPIRAARSAVVTLIDRLSSLTARWLGPTEEPGRRCPTGATWLVHSRPARGRLHVSWGTGSRLG